MELTITFIILSITIFLFIIGKIRADLVALLSLLALTVTGILDVQEALAGFANSTVIMLAGLFIVGGGIVRTGLAQMAGRFLLRFAGESETRLFILLFLVVAIVGSFISNTGTVAIMLPIVVTMAISMKLSPSTYLIPLAFASSLSGFMTLISTPTNLIVSETLVENGFEKLSFFSITPLGIIAFITGIVYILSVRHLLPKDDRKKRANQSGRSPNELIKQYRLSEKLHRVIIPSHSKLVNRVLGELNIPSRYHVIVLAIEHKNGEGFSLLNHPQQEMAGPDSKLQPNDILYLEGAPENVARFAVDYELQIEPHDETEQFVSKTIGIAEALLTPNSKFIHKTISEAGFRKRYGVNVIGVNRKGQYILENISDLSLRFGDALLLQGTWEDIEYLSQDTKDMVIVGQPKKHASEAAAMGKAPIAFGILFMMVMFMVLDIFPTVVSVSIAAIGMILTGCLRNMDDAYSHINWESLVLIAAMLPMGTALEKTGGIALLSEFVIHYLGEYGPIGILAGIYLLTALFGQFVSNTATAVLFAPIAINAAVGIGANPIPFVMAVAVAAATSFATPFSTPANALVMTAGNFTFMDFFKVGMPLVLIMFIVMIIFIPIIYPF
ncbi:SLC13 family permease [Fervidibacillus halotolerans]|uniref:SLC13 family permease n=1 Tax=Fervidibacillus halotolerans TaxID=2980027 RepID=A0A9E8M207_9BACI|nr:SLC13 family permease [Fervidibacillus halotolerans]WAA13445.1 SLC13 family permease [Fervidibacillus halotolerans]